MNSVQVVGTLRGNLRSKQSGVVDTLLLSEGIQALPSEVSNDELVIMGTRHEQSHRRRQRRAPLT